ncbi:FHA domain-containing protein [Planctomycetota bacterium]
MYLVVKKDNKTVDELRFTKGPVYIGRHKNSQVFLHDRAVSRQHAVIFATQDGQWIVEDLDSANKTYLNDKAIHKSKIKNGDVLRIADFTIEIVLEEKISSEEKQLNLADTLTTTSNELQTIVRKLDTSHAPEIRLSSQRIKQYVSATDAICSSRGLDQLILALLSLLLRQFSAFHTWCALRDEPEGPMISHGGRTQSGESIKLDDIKLKGRVTEALEKKHFLLFPRLPLPMQQEKLRSAMIAPVLGPAGCFGVLYIDNSMNHEHYDSSDLDYLMLIAIHTAAIVKNY